MRRLQHRVTPRHFTASNTAYSGIGALPSLRAGRALVNHARSIIACKPHAVRSWPFRRPSLAQTVNAQLAANLALQLNNACLVRALRAVRSGFRSIPLFRLIDVLMGLAWTKLPQPVFECADFLHRQLRSRPFLIYGALRMLQKPLAHLQVNSQIAHFLTQRLDFRLLYIVCITSL